MKTIILILPMIILLASCSDSKIKNEIKNEYEKLAKDNDSKITIYTIELLNSKSVNFESLANSEIAKIEELNELRTEQLKLFRRKDSLFNVKIEHRNCLSKNANSEYQLKYSKDNKADSARLRENHKRQVWTELEKVEDEIKILEIYELARLDSIWGSENLIVKHKIDIKINDKRIIDTLYYISFNNRKYKYLNKNLFIEN